MPLFNHHTPTTQGDMAAMRATRIKKPSLPIGMIGENNLFGYGYDGDKYYVTEGVWQYLVTGVHLTFDEAKQMFDALTFNECSEPDVKIVSSAVYTARKQKIFGEDLFWFLTDKL